MQLTIGQAAELLRASEAQVRKWIRDRGLPAVVFNEQYRLNRIDLIVWAHDNRIAVDDEGLAAFGVVGNGIQAALRRGGIHRDVEGDTRAAAVRAAVARVALPASVDRDVVREMVEAREAAGSTAIGGGIAIPHARYPIVAALGDPILGLAMLRAPVDFGAPDGAPVGSVFVLVAPTIRAHLDMLARLARALSAALGAAVSARADDETIFAAARGSDRAT